MALTYTLVRECLNNTEDVAGRWQIEGGQVLQGNKHVANYSSVKRVSCGTKEQNTAMLWLTLFFLKGKPPENMLEPASAVVERRGALFRANFGEDVRKPQIDSSKLLRCGTPCSKVHRQRSTRRFRFLSIFIHPSPKLRRPVGRPRATARPG